MNPIGPRACYDEGKRVAETMIYAYHKQVCATTHSLCVVSAVVSLLCTQDNVEVRVARIFNTYGPRMHMYDGAFSPGWTADICSYLVS